MLASVIVKMLNKVLLPQHRTLYEFKLLVGGWGGGKPGGRVAYK